MKTIILSKGQITYVDDEDFEYLFNWIWYCNSYGYATRTYKRKGKMFRLYIHRVIMNAKIGSLIDHIDGNPLNNQKNNLRFVTRKENAQNRKRGVNNKSGFIGVSWDNYNKKWKAQAMHNGKQKFLGNFDNAEEAAICRDQFVKKSYSYSTLNFPT